MCHHFIYAALIHWSPTRFCCKDQLIINCILFISSLERHHILLSACVVPRAIRSLHTIAMSIIYTPNCARCYTYIHTVTRSRLALLLFSLSANLGNRWSQGRGISDRALYNFVSQTQLKPTHICKRFDWRKHEMLIAEVIWTTVESTGTISSKEYLD